MSLKSIVQAYHSMYEAKKAAKDAEDEARKKNENAEGEFETYLEFLSQTNSKGLI